MRQMKNIPLSISPHKNKGVNCMNSVSRKKGWIRTLLFDGIVMLYFIHGPSSFLTMILTPVLLFECRIRRSTTQIRNHCTHHHNAKSSAAKKHIFYGIPQRTNVFSTSILIVIHRNEINFIVSYKISVWFVQDEWYFIQFNNCKSVIP